MVTSPARKTQINSCHHFWGGPGAGQQSRLFDYTNSKTISLFKLGVLLDRRQHAVAFCSFLDDCPTATKKFLSLPLSFGKELEKH